MKDKLILVVVAALVAVGAWFFWHEAQSEGFNIISIIAIVVLGADNYRLRKANRLLRSSASHGLDR